ncbi:MAG: hypothetical protein JWP89_3687 [Schlesneria sp.]|nr:hypothetical protein [Schlesneria sp.]
MTTQVLSKTPGGLKRFAAPGQAGGTATPDVKRQGQRALVPMAGETQPQFFARASRALQRQIPSVNRRTIEILRIWKLSSNDKDLRDKAAAMFPKAKFVHFGPRCIFLEHTVPASVDTQQPEITYGQQELQQLVDWANYRIRNSDNFAVISDGHTPSQDEKAKGAGMPSPLGYSGPFYLGQLGDVDPLWAIYADEWVHRDDVPRFEKLQRRSPEVWASEPMSQRTLDPIAALGAETPKLDCGMNLYARASDGQLVMRYSAATLPGPTNSFVPSAERRTRQHYSGEPRMDGDNMNATPDLTTAVGQALQDLLPSIVQAVVAQVASQTEGPSDDDVNLQPQVPEDDDGPDEPTAEPEAAEVPDDDDPEADKYKAMGPDCHAAYLAGRRGATKYSRMADDGLTGIISRQVARIRMLEVTSAADRRDVARYQRLGNLSREYAFDPNEELQTCRDMTDVQFERHCAATVTKYSRRGDITSVELFEDPGFEPDRYSRGGLSRVSPDQVERYSRQAALAAAHKNAMKKGSTTFEQEFDAICQKHGMTL